MLPEELSPGVTARVPVVVSRDDRYFQDIYQAMPKLGYGRMVRNMLLHPKIRVILNTRWQDIKSEVKYSRMIFTGPIDEYFGYSQGHLPYRSLRFDVQTLPVDRCQDAAVINYPNEYDYTRITEQKWLTGQQHAFSTILTEYPLPHVVGETIPYYPIHTDVNRDLYRRYKAEANILNGKVLFAGRLADYQYYNMDQAIAAALKNAADLQ
jgi:UDP-galactopyranose mutase